MQLYIQMRRPSGFLTRMFTVKPGNIYNGEKVAIDIRRFGETIAPVITKIVGAGNLNDISQFTTKEFTPPAYGEEFALSIEELLERMAGVDPYTAAYQDYASQLIGKMMTGWMVIDDKIQRAIELQASQVLQTGTLSLPDVEGNASYTLDFKPKATHFPTSSTTWGQTGDTKLSDLASLAKVVRKDGKVDPDELIFGEAAFREFLLDDDVVAQLDNRRMNVGVINPRYVDSGATFQGTIWIGNYQFGMYSYPETYEDMAGDVQDYISTGKVVMKSSRTRLDLASARVPRPLPPDPRVANFVPGRLSSAETGIDVMPNVYPTPSGEQIMGKLSSRPICIPVQIDGFGCLDTGLTA